MDLAEHDNIPQMVMDFIVDGFQCCIERWLLDKNCVTAEEFIGNLKQLIYVLIIWMKK